MAKKVYQLKISLRFITPEIWRRILLPADYSLTDLHKIIQTCMGWSNKESHRFIVKARSFMAPSKAGEKMKKWDYIDYEQKDVRVADILKKPRNKIAYEYDLDKSWLHDIVLEEILPFDDEFKYPMCVGGKNNTPPESFEGPEKYNKMLESLFNPDNEEYKTLQKWREKGFDPDYYNRTIVNLNLHKDNFGSPA
ncbi:MAG: plasmid pRiA4b ORF-3 family protein [Bacteroidota bacterium]